MYKNKSILVILFIMFLFCDLFSQVTNYPDPFSSVTGNVSGYGLTNILDSPISGKMHIDTIIVKDTLYRPDYGYILDSVTVKVSDSDSIHDVSSVYFLSIKPDGNYAQGGEPFSLHKLNDSLYFLIFQLTSYAETGTYKWIFFARDNVNNVSDSVVKYIHVLGNLTSIKNDYVPTGIYQLNQNYPNPFNPNTKISFTIPQSNNVELKIFDISGKEIITLIDEYKSAGRYEVELHCEDLPSGIYFYRIKCGNFIQTKKLTLLK